MSFRKKKVQPNIHNSKRIKCETTELFETRASDGHDLSIAERKLQTPIDLSASNNVIALEQAEKISTYPQNITFITPETQKKLSNKDISLLTQETQKKLSNEDISLSSDVFIKKLVKEQTTFLNDLVKTSDDVEKNEKVEKLLKKRTKIIPKVSSRNSRPVDNINYMNEMEKTDIKCEKTEQPAASSVGNQPVNYLTEGDKKDIQQEKEKKGVQHEGERKLNKRTKILPNISLINKTKTIVAEGDKKHNQSEVEKKYIQQESDEKDNQLEVEKKLNKQTKILPDISLKNITLEPLVKQKDIQPQGDKKDSQQEGEVKNVQHKGEKEDKHEGERKLSKRTKILPNISLKNKTKTLELSIKKKDILPEGDEKEIQSGVEKKNIQQESDQIDIQHVGEKKDNQHEGDKKGIQREGEKKLNKRTKIVPNISLKNKNKTLEHSIEQKDDTHFSVSKLEKSLGNLSDSVSGNETLKIENEVISESKFLESLETKNDCLINNAADDTIEIIDMIEINDSLGIKKNTISIKKKDHDIDVDFDVGGKVETTDVHNGHIDRHVEIAVLDVQEGKKHVRFDNHTNFEDRKHKAENEEEKENNTDNINNEMHSSHDSHSDGEVGTKLPVSGKKVFRPNFEVQRRKKRLSSFSAYSSCDEDENISKKKRKKKKLSNVKSSDSNEEGKADIKISKNKQKIKSKKKVSGTSKEQKEKVEYFSIEKNMSGLTMQELISYRPRSFKKVELKAKSSLEEGRVIETANSIPMEEPDFLIEDENDVMAPQIMINEDGEIVINQNSLTIKKKVDNTMLKKNGIVYEDSLSYHSGRKKRKIKHWGMDDTLRFYKALSEIGTDFTLMAQAFGRFTRNELKKKFKQEEKINCDLVDRALLNRLPLDMKTFLIGRKERKMIEEAENEEKKIDEIENKENEQKHVVPVAVNSDEHFLTS